MAQPTENTPTATPDEPFNDLPPAPDYSPDLVPPAASPESSLRYKVPHTRTSAAWFGIWAGVAALILLIIFVAQNTRAVEVSFLWMHGQISLALALLIAGVGGAVIAMAVAAVRIVQLRRLLHRRP
jgi:uncharacterized integral membrane protein